MLRSFLSVFAGLLVFMLGVTVLQGMMARVYPLPAFDPRDPAAVAAAIAAMPAGSFGMLLAGYAVGALCGGAVASAIATRARMRHALVVGIVTTLGGVANFVLLPHPAWVVVCGLPLFILMALAGGRLGLRLTR